MTILEGPYRERLPRRYRIHRWLAYVLAGVSVLLLLTRCAGRQRAQRGAGSPDGEQPCEVAR